MVPKKTSFYCEKFSISNLEAVKILFTGTIHTGKSTLLHRLQTDPIPNCGLIEETARKLLSQHPELEKLQKFQDILFAQQVELENQMESKNTQFIICDRGVLDIVAYARFFGHPVKRAWLEWCKTYDKAFIFDKADVPFTNDIIDLDPQYEKSRDWIDFRNGLDQHFKNVLQELNIPYALLSGTVEHRLSHIRIELLSPSRNVEYERAKKEAR